MCREPLLRVTWWPVAIEAAAAAEHFKWSLQALRERGLLEKPQMFQEENSPSVYSARGRDGK